MPDTQHDRRADRPARRAISEGAAMAEEMRPNGEGKPALVGVSRLTWHWIATLIALVRLLGSGLFVSTGGS